MNGQVKVIRLSIRLLLCDKLVTTSYESSATTNYSDIHQFQNVVIFASRIVGVLLLCMGLVRRSPTVGF